MVGDDDPRIFCFFFVFIKAPARPREGSACVWVAPLGWPPPGQGDANVDRELFLLGIAAPNNRRRPARGLGFCGFTPEALSPAWTSRGASASPARSRTPGASTPRCTASSRGRCASTPGFATAEETNERFRYLLAARRAGAVDRVRPPDAARHGLRRPAGRGRGGPGRRGDRLGGGHGAPVRRHPARPRLDEHDHQRPGRRAAAALPARGRGERGRPGGPARHDPERRAQGVRGPRQLHLPAGAVDAADHRHVRLLRRRAAAAGTRSRSAGTTSARRAPRRCRRWRSRWPTASPTSRRRSRRAWTSTGSGRGCRSSSTPTTTCWRRSRSSGPPARCGPTSCATASARPRPGR